MDKIILYTIPKKLLENCEEYEVLVYANMRRAMNYDNNICLLKAAQIAERCYISIDKAIKAIEGLIAKKFIEVVRYQYTIAYKVVLYVKNFFVTKNLLMNCTIPAWVKDKYIQVIPYIKKISDTTGLIDLKLSGKWVDWMIKKKYIEQIDNFFFY